MPHDEDVDLNEVSEVERHNREQARKGAHEYDLKVKEELQKSFNPEDAEPKIYEIEEEEDVPDLEEVNEE